MTKLPVPAYSLPALGGQTALFEDPALILRWDDAFLRTVAANLGREGGSILAQLRRATGLVAWAGWHRFDGKPYEEFIAGIADSLGVTVRTVRNWREAVVKSDSLAIPAVPAQRKREAAGRKTAGQGQGDTTLSTKSAPIPAASRVAPPKKSEEGGQRSARENDPARESAETPGLTTGPPSSDPLPELPPVAPPGVDDADGSGNLSGGGAGASGQARLPASPPPPGPITEDPIPVVAAILDRVTEDVVIRWLAARSDQEVKSIGAPYRSTWETEVRRWAILLGISPASLLRGEIGKEAESKRRRRKAKLVEADPQAPSPLRQGTISRPPASSNGHREVTPMFKGGK